MLHERLWEQNQDLAQASLGHSFVEALRDGTLGASGISWLHSPRRFLSRSLRPGVCFGTGPQPRLRANRPVSCTHRRCCDELKLHAAYAAELKIDLSQVQPHPVCRAYTDFLLATAWRGSLGEVLAAMTPCMRLYAFLGKELLLQIGGEGKVKKHPYERWITTYSGPDMQEPADHIESLLDRFSTDTPAVQQAYRYGMQCEVGFFSAAMETPAQVSEVRR